MESAVFLRGSHPPRLPKTGSVRWAADSLLPVDYTLGGVHVHGFASKPAASRANRTMQHFFINGRYVKTRTAMAALEQELGAPLFQKSGRGIALGRYGAALLPQAQQIVTLADNCLRSFQMLREGIGTLRIQTIPLLLVPLVTRLCRQFKAAHPGCDFTFSTGMSSQVCQSVLEGEADLGFCSKIFSDPQLEYVAIQSRPMVAAVPLDHPLAQQESVTLEKTLPYPHVTYSWLSGQRDPVDRLFAPVRDRWHIAYEVEDANFILELVAQGFGITVLPDTPPVHRPGVKRLPVTDPVQTSDFYIVRQKAPHLLAAADQFFDYCVGQANGMDLTNEQLPPSAR